MHEQATLRATTTGAGEWERRQRERDGERHDGRRSGWRAPGTGCRCGGREGRRGSLPATRRCEGRRRQKSNLDLARRGNGQRSTDLAGGATSGARRRVGERPGESEVSAPQGSIIQGTLVKLHTLSPARSVDAGRSRTARQAVRVRDAGAPKRNRRNDVFICERTDRNKKRRATKGHTLFDGTLGVQDRPSCPSPGEAGCDSTSSTSAIA